MVRVKVVAIEQYEPKFRSGHLYIDVVDMYSPRLNTSICSRPGVFHDLHHVGLIEVLHQRDRGRFPAERPVPTSSTEGFFVSAALLTSHCLGVVLSGTERSGKAEGKEAGLKRAQSSSSQCKYWLNTGRCSNGEMCHFQHAQVCNLC